MDELYMLLNEFKDQTQKAIELIYEDKFEDLLYVLEIREHLIRKIDVMSFDKTYLVSICEELNIPDIDEKLNVLVNYNYFKVKEKLASLRFNRSINEKYKNTETVSPMFVSKKI